MQQRLNELSAQRARLVERIAAERRTLSIDLVPVRRAVDVSARVNGMVDEVKQLLLRNPLAIAVGVGALVLFKPRSVVRWAQRGLTLWRTVRSAKSLMPGFLFRYFTGPR